MKNLIFILLFLSAALSGYGVYSYFEKFHRAKNPLAKRPQLVVLTHSSFMGPFGPGPALAERFEKICMCDIELVDAGGNQLLLEKLKLPGANFDVVVGLDQLSLKSAAANIDWRRLKVPNQKWVPVFKENHYGYFLPYDWSPMTFIFRKADFPNPPTSLSEFVKSLPEKSLILPDPELSTPGLQFVYWNHLFPEQFQGLNRALRSLAPDWSGAYGLFKRKQAQVTFSYVTSLVYHWEQEDDFSYQVANLADGHPLQIEYAAVPNICRSCALAERFVEFILEPDSQKEIMTKNFMFPVVEGLIEGTAFERLPSLKPISNQGMDAFVDDKFQHMKQWKSDLDL